MKVITEPVLQKVGTSKHFPNPTWEFNPVVSPRQVALTRRLLDDFAYQWRHVLRSSYNGFTFYQLACATIRIATLDFDVREVIKGRQAVGSSKMVRLDDLPSWQPTYESVIPLERVTIIVSQHLTNAMNLLFADFEPKQAGNGGACLGITYIVLSVREVFLYKAWTCSDHDHAYTKPEPLLNGAGGPSEKALAYLLMVALPDHNVSSSLHCLPLELQDMIVDSISSGTLKSAKVACLLSLGSPYLWQGPYGPVKLGCVVPARASSAAESQIWFDDFWSGLVYTVDMLPSVVANSMLMKHKPS